jgi:hypothetical protein
LKKIIKEIFFNNIGLTCNFAELIIIHATSETPAIIAAIHPTFNTKNHRTNLDTIRTIAPFYSEYAEGPVGSEDPNTNNIAEITYIHQNTPAVKGAVPGFVLIIEAFRCWNFFCQGDAGVEKIAVHPVCVGGANSCRLNTLTPRPLTCKMRKTTAPVM